MKLLVFVAHEIASFTVWLWQPCRMKLLVFVSHQFTSLQSQLTHYPSRVVSISTFHSTRCRYVLSHEFTGCEARRKWLVTHEIATLHLSLQ
nr:MAG TPA: hypothetical protein [Caudoviricetes sp.]